MQIERKKIRDMDRAAYNPRIDLIPGDTEYENLRRSIITYGMIIPVVWNERTNRVVGGHQRLTVLENEGETETDVSVVDLDETQERQLNVALNKIEGGWDDEKLGQLLAELGDDAPLTGFTQAEIDSLTNDINSLINLTWDANAARRSFSAISPCASTPTRGAATGANTVSRRRNRTLPRYSGTKASRPCARSSRGSGAGRRHGATGTSPSIGEE